ncbi:MAG: exodeoxyribonuclease I [Gammaproteobacteria bacterium]|nr:MAG: exodeoxyribonuclease I [Gammaproteobacteria bacterium]
MNPRTTSFYWHDYETWGADPARDRAAQFAGLRTDLDFNPIGEPLVIYAQPADDMLPQPGACMVTGISPQRALAEGVPEADFFRFIHAEMMQPGTCSLGFNTIRFDDEVTRYGLYRNFFDPYEREWKNGNSRWDMIDVVRLTRALRPEGIEWPVNEEGVTSFRLEHLTAANEIEHLGAHDALADVRATIAIARLVRDRQPRLFDYVFTHRDKQTLAALLDPAATRPVLHVSARYPARLGCIAAVLPLAMHPRNRNSVIVYDLRSDPEPLLLLDAEALRERLYTRSEDLPEGVERIALKEVHINKAPVVVPLNTLTDRAREEWQMDAATEQRHLALLLAHRAELQAKLAEVYAEREFEPRDPDLDLYGGFLTDADRRRCDRVRSTPPEQLAGLDLRFDAPKMNELLFRYRARNWPDTLGPEERARWDEWRRARVRDPQGPSSITLDQYRRELARLAVDADLPEDRRRVVDDLLEWPERVGLD